jgi:GTPase SAR1 family protein|nr:MAG TPA: ATPase [Caudoviricetes sp.]
MLKIGFVGAPQSGKSSLIEYLRNLLKDEYQVVIADEPPTILLKVGLDPASGVISSLDFQKECLLEYHNVYERISKYSSVYSNSDKPTIVLMDTLPEIGKCYLNDEETKVWEEHYNLFWRNNVVFETFKPDIIFNLELLQGEFSTKGNAVRRDLDVEYILSIDEKICNTYPSAIRLANDIGIEERANEVADIIDSALRNQN